MNLLERISSRRTESRDIGLSQYLQMAYGTYSVGGNTYPVTQTYSTGTAVEKSVGNAGSAYTANGVLFACAQARALLFSEARFMFQRMRNGRPGDLWGDPSLTILERPFVNGTTGDLLTRMEQDVTISGNWFATSSGGEIKRLNPDWVDIIRGGNNEITAELVGYAYHAGGPGGDVYQLGPDQVAHYAPIPDPMSRHRGMSWVTPVIRELMGDNAATEHKNAFFRNGATPNMIVKFDPTITEEKARVWKQLMEEEHVGAWNAYKNLYIGGGADATVVGSDFKQIDFKNVQGAGETRIAAAAGVPPVIVGLSEGLQAATYSNYAQARRRFADGTMRPLWRMAAGVLERFAQPPTDSRLWYDDRDIPFLQEDQKDAADIQSVEGQTIRTLVDGGFTPASVVDAVMNSDFTRLEHTELFSVQLQPPGTMAPPTDTPAASMPMDAPQGATQ
jgi:phage portal protein BeeE